VDPQQAVRQEVDFLVAAELAALAQKEGLPVVLASPPSLVLDTPGEGGGG
jgi:hypothetical protein